MSPEYLPPLLAGATAAVAENYVAPIVPVVMVSPIHQEEEQPPIVLPATGKEDDLRTAEVRHRISNLYFTKFTIFPVLSSTLSAWTQFQAVK